MAGLITFGPHEVDLTQGVLRVRGEVVALQPLPWRLLVYLLERPGLLVSRDELIEMLWPGQIAVSDGSLGQVVHRLRRVLDGDLLRTVPRRGYRLDVAPEPTAPVRGGTPPRDPDAVRPPPDLFIGREGVLREISAQRRAGVRLLVLVGPGGVGKTRIAREWAQHAEDVVFVQAAPLTDASELPSAVLRSLGATTEHHDPSDAVKHVLAQRGRSCLLVDNLEHLGVGAARHLGRWLSALPELSIVATSRSVLGAPGERVLTVPPLAAREARQLLADRSGLAADRPDLEPLAAALDGLPLAIELAASRLRVLSPEALLAGMNHRLSVLREVRPRSDRPPRHQSLQAALEHSWGMLARVEQEAMGRLVAWVSPFTLEQAAVVLGPSFGALDQLHSLVEQSLVQVQGDGRFGVLPSMQAFVREVASNDALLEGEHRHGAHLAELGLPLTERVGRLEEHSHVQLTGLLQEALVACRRAVARGDGRVALGASMAAFPGLTMRDRPSRLLPLLDQVEPLLRGSERRALLCLRARVFHRVGRGPDALAVLETAMQEAKQEQDLPGFAHIELLWALCGEECLETSRGLRVVERVLADLDGLPPEAARAAWNLKVRLQIRAGAPREVVEHDLAAYAQTVERGRALQDDLDVAAMRAYVLLSYGEVRLATQAVEEVVELAGKIGSPHASDRARFNLSAAYVELGELDRAFELCDVLISECRERHPQFAAGAVFLRALALQWSGRHEQARRTMQQAVDAIRSTGHPRYIGMVLLDAAEMAWVQGDPVAAERTAAEAEAALGNMREEHAFALGALAVRSALHHGRLAVGEGTVAELWSHPRLLPRQRLDLWLFEAEIGWLQHDRDRARVSLERAQEVLEEMDVLPTAPAWQQTDRIVRMTQPHRLAHG